MLKFALKNMAIKKVQVILIVLSIVISAGIAVLAFNVATQVDEGITDNAGFYSAIIGPAGSNTQLAMNCMYFTEEPIGTIPIAPPSIPMAHCMSPAAARPTEPRSIPAADCMSTTAARQTTPRSMRAALCMSTAAARQWILSGHRALALYTLQMAPM